MARTVCPLLRIRLASLVGLALLAGLAGNASSAPPAVTGAVAAVRATPAEGVRFTCEPAKLERMAEAMPEYLRALDIAPRFVATRRDDAAGTLTYTLTTPEDDVTTLDFSDRPEFRLEDATVLLPLKNGRSRTVRTTSAKEILLALLQHGRLTEFTGAACDIGALRDHVGIRQNTVAWAEVLEFGWPDGGSAKWNEKYWKRGTPKPGYRLHVAINDMFLQQKKYEIGCYTATKMVMIQGVLDYYHRVKKDPVTLKLVEARLSVAGEPLVDIEPGRVWDFDPAFDPNERLRPGKLLSVGYGVAPKNFVPGDWLYIVNTDLTTAAKTGYEGSNAIYLGRNKFDDYYNDHDHAYSYRQKMHEVYQWRHGVFSASRDAAKVQPLTALALERLGATPENGGQVLSLRMAPYLFGYEPLPAWPFNN